MKHPIPPDRDPELRRAFAMNADEQRTLLNAMAGVPHEEPRCLPSTLKDATEIRERLRKLLERGQQ